VLLLGNQGENRDRGDAKKHPPKLVSPNFVIASVKGSP